jgi:hypothetical protein
MQTCYSQFTIPQFRSGLFSFCQSYYDLGLRMIPSVYDSVGVVICID